MLFPAGTLSIFLLLVARFPVTSFLFLFNSSMKTSPTTSVMDFKLSSRTDLGSRWRTSVLSRGKILVFRNPDFRFVLILSSNLIVIFLSRPGNSSFGTDVQRLPEVDSFHSSKSERQVIFRLRKTATSRGCSR
uniref:Putative secreted protein n=1 Tax=Ixodes ricinus TaxID=34613 RepID=A0A6B0URH1_IXORI